MKCYVCKKEFNNWSKNYACSKECKSVWFSDKEIKQPIKEENNE